MIREMAQDRWPRRGEVWWVAFDPSVGGEARKTRPAVVVSRDSANRSINRVQVVPLTSSTNRLYPSEAYVTLGGERRKAMADQLGTVSKLRLRDTIGHLNHDDCGCDSVTRYVTLDKGILAGTDANLLDVKVVAR